jgi:hypothetical protein
MRLILSICSIKLSQIEERAPNFKKAGADRIPVAQLQSAMRFQFGGHLEKSAAR